MATTYIFLFPFPLLIFFITGGYSGGRDDAKILVPATVLLRYMFTPAELRVMFLCGYSFSVTFQFGLTGTVNCTQSVNK